MEPTAYALRNTEGLYYFIDNKGALKTSAAPVYVTGVPAAIRQPAATGSLTFTGQARNIIARIYGTMGKAAACSVVFEGMQVRLNFYGISVRAECVTLAAHRPIAGQSLAGPTDVHHHYLS